MPLVARVAAKVRLRLPRQVEVAELISAGYVGLIDAADKFDPARGVAFGAYARRRIAGAIIDALRELDPLSRDARQQVKAGLAQDHFEVQLHLDDPGHARAFKLYKLEGLADAAPLPDASIVTLLQTERIRRIVAALPERERYVIEQYFWADRLLGDIGADLGISTTLVSQIKRQACERLRVALMC